MYNDTARQGEQVIELEPRHEPSGEENSVCAPGFVRRSQWGGCQEVEISSKRPWAPLVSCQILSSLQEGGRKVSTLSL